MKKTVFLLSEAPPLPGSWEEEDDKSSLSPFDSVRRGHDGGYAKKEDYSKLATYIKDNSDGVLGTGSSRKVFKVGSSAYKIALNEGGIIQNEAEITILGNPEVIKLGITIPMIDFDKKNPGRPVWIQVELAEPLEFNPAKFCEIFGIDSKRYSDGDKAASLAQRAWKLWTNNINFPKNIEEGLVSPTKTIRMFQKIRGLLKVVPNLEHSDLLAWHNWGLFQGKPVILDVGYTKESMKAIDRTEIF